MISKAAPLHPILVHFTISLVVVSMLFDLAGRYWSSPSLTGAGWWTVAASVPLTLLTVVTGLISRLRVDVAEGRALKYLRAHEWLGPSFLGCLAAMGYWRWTAWSAGSVPSLWYLMTFAALILLMTLQGYLGGELVYAFGMEVRDERYARLPLHDAERGD